MTARTVSRQHPAHRDDIADLITRRPLPGPTVQQVDPFLFLNHHGPQTYPPNNRGLPFGPHPHRGFETVTFIIEGEMSHLDSGGHESIIRAGGVQWMTAGSGIVHAELSPEAFKRAGGALELLQLWVNLPSRLKMSPPRYTGLQIDEIPVVDQDQGRARIQLIAGDLDDAKGPVETLTGVFMSTVSLAAGGKARLPAPRGRNVFCYVVRGAPTISGVDCKIHHLIELTDGEGVEIEAPAGAFLAFGHAEPINEPVFSHGPFVMTTREEIIQAINDYNAGKFGRIG